MCTYKLQLLFIETYDLVDTYITQNKKRFHIPNLDLSALSNDNSIDAETEKDSDKAMNEETIQEVQNKKKSRKVLYYIIIYKLVHTLFYKVL